MDCPYQGGEEGGEGGEGMINQWEELFANVEQGIRTNPVPGKKYYIHLTCANGSEGLFPLPFDCPEDAAATIAVTVDFFPPDSTIDIVVKCNEEVN
jgi:hypothetical protein